ncbi:MAG: FecR domain-containing protein [bacterium]
MNKRNSRAFIVAGILFALCLINVPPYAHTAMTPVGQVDMVEGIVYIMHEGHKKAIEAKKGDTIYPRDEITTESQAKIKISFINHSMINLGENSLLTITSIIYMPEKSLCKSFFKLYAGKIMAIIEKFTNPDSKFEIETKTAIAGVAGTEEIIAAYKDPETMKYITRVICRKGRIRVRSSDRKIPEEIFLGPLEQSYIIEEEPPQEKIEITIEELEEIIHMTTIQSGPGAVNVLPGTSKVKRAKKGAVPKDQTPHTAKEGQTTHTGDTKPDRQAEGGEQTQQADETGQVKQTDETEHAGQTDAKDEMQQPGEEEYVDVEQPAEEAGLTEDIKDIMDKESDQQIGENGIEDELKQVGEMQESLEDMEADIEEEIEEQIVDIEQDIEADIEEELAAIEQDIEADIEDIEADIEEIEKDIEDDVHTVIPLVDEILPTPPEPPSD